MLGVLGACGVGLIGSFFNSFQLFSFLLLWFCGWNLLALGLLNDILLTDML